MYNERNKNNEVKLDDERKGRSMYLYKKEVRKFVKGRFIVGKGTMKRPLCMEKGYDNTTIQDIVNELGGLTKGAKHPGFGRAEERDREKGCEGVGVLLEMREGG